MTDRLFIVVIDSDKSMCRALSRLLRAAQMEVKSYASSDEFLLSVDGQDPDCLVLNIQVPGITDNVLRHRLAEVGRTLPMVLITSSSGVHREPRDSDLEVLHKPFDEEILLAAIGRAIRGREAP